MIPFAAWTPDQPEHLNPGATIAHNVIPQLESYSPFRSPQSLTTALANACLGSYWVQDNAGSVFNFAGDNTQLYELNGSTWNVVGTGLLATNWEFIKFGQRIMAFSGLSDPQYFDLGVSANFATLPNAPRASRAAVTRDFIMLGGLDSDPEAIQWSGFNDTEYWTPNLSRQSDTQPLRGRGGRVQRLVPGDIVTIFQEHSIQRTTYVGGSTLFTFDEVERGRGTPAPNSVCWTGDTIFYYGQDGFYAFTDRSQPIGANRVDRWFSRSADQTALDSMRGVVDRQNRLVIWAYRSSASKPINDKVIVYNWVADKWSEATIDSEVIAEYLTEGMTLEQADIIFGTNSDAINLLSDSDAFVGGRLSLSLFGSDHTLQTLSGDPLQGEMETKETGGGKRTFINSVRPLVDGPASVCAVTRDVLGDPLMVTNPIPQNRVGECTLTSNARYHRYRVLTNGNFNHAQGVEVQGRTAGRL